MISPTDMSRIHTILIHTYLKVYFIKVVMDQTTKELSRFVEQ